MMFKSLKNKVLMTKIKFSVWISYRNIFELCMLKSETSEVVINCTLKRVHDV